MNIFSRKGLGVGAAAALVLGGAFATATPAEASPYGYKGPRAVYGPAYRPVRGPVYRPVRAYPHRYYAPRNPGAAVAAGVLGGLALGAIASQAYAAPAFGPCWTENRVAFDAWGRQFVQPVRVCR
ncbi:MAG TPA: hypothetical protein VM434_03750 [Beijerinckiaceae bacterium]|nr:hypothetical protein [Beijerinckiaceae bacterium]